MKERPIIFTVPTLIEGILNGIVTQTRRVIKPCSAATLHDGSQPEWVFTLAKCPYGQVGDRLWVKETFVIEEAGDSEEPKDRPFKYDLEYGLLIPHYRATEPDIELVTEEQEDNVTKWRPSIFMPRWAPRVTLEITEVRVERLQEITHDDIVKEGIIPIPFHSKTEFKTLWDSLNAKRGYGWEANPFVWVISFKVVK